ncbi:hypothetical protein BH11ACT7_BH11ACT7_06230 [soil metagenome]
MGVQAAVLPSTESPHTLVFFIATMVFLVLPVITVDSRRSLSWQRKIYWGSTVSASVCVIFASMPSLLTGGVFTLLIIFTMSLRAYFTSQYIKIGGRVIAFHSAVEISARPGGSGELGTDEPYSPTVSAARLWWLLTVGVSIFGAGNMWKYVADREDLRYGLLGLGIVVGMAVLCGIGDAMHLQRIARGQYVQFAIISLSSAGIFAVLYLIAHSVTLWLKKSSS